MVISVVKREIHNFANLTLWHDRWNTWLDSFSQLDLSHTLLKLVAIALAKVEIKVFLNITWSHDQWVTRLDGLDTLTVSQSLYSKSNKRT